MYLGDAVYVDEDGDARSVTTEDGARITNRIVLEPAVWRGLLDDVKTVKARSTIPMSSKTETG